jgi:hypothetical protein
MHGFDKHHQFCHLAHLFLNFLFCHRHDTLKPLQQDIDLTETICSPLIEQQSRMQVNVVQGDLWKNECVCTFIYV